MGGEVPLVDVRSLVLRRLRVMPRVVKWSRKRGGQQKGGQQ